MLIGGKTDVYFERLADENTGRLTATYAYKHSGWQSDNHNRQDGRYNLKKEAGRQSACM